MEEPMSSQRPKRDLSRGESDFFPARAGGRRTSLWSTTSKAALRVSALGTLIQGALVDLKMVDAPKYPRHGYQRYVLSVLGCWALVCVYALRVNMSVALLAMKNETVVVNGTEEPVSDSERWETVSEFEVANSQGFCMNVDEVCLENLPLPGHAHALVRLLHEHCSWLFVPS